MATAKKTPSGMWKVRVYSHTTPDQKKHYRAFTAPTKQEAEQMAARFSGDADRAAKVDLTVEEALLGYIRARDGVLSVSTIRGYYKIARNHFDGIKTIRIRRLTSEQVQTHISQLSREKSAKTVKNAYGLLTAAINFYLPDKTLHVKLPAKEVKRLQSVTDDDVRLLLDHARGWLKLCIGLSAFGSLRRGEVCALTYGDVTDGVIYVHADMVEDNDGKWILKAIPKTTDSVRYVYTVPQEILALIGDGAPEERIIKRTPNEVTKYFIQLRDSLGLTCRYQDLRGYYASTAPVLGVPDIYTSDFGGWRRGSGVLKEHYQKNMQSESDRYADMMRRHFDDLVKKV